LIELFIHKRLDEVDMVDHPKYCKYHQIVSHPIEKCFVLKDLIIHMKNEGKIQLEGGEETTNTNMTMIFFESFNLIPVLSLLCKKKVIIDANDSTNHISQITLLIQFKVVMIEDFKDLNLPQNLKMKLDMDDLRLFLKRKKNVKDMLC